MAFSNAIRFFQHYWQCSLRLPSAIARAFTAVNLPCACALSIVLVLGMAHQSSAQLPLVSEMDLPQPVVTVLDLANELPARQEAELATQLEDLEAATGWKLRVLTQFDRSPGRAVKTYWQL
ncbi:MAG: TPM domain-containing protein, partial [Cyanobacteria bacterium P01_D01_bin.123]